MAENAERKIKLLLLYDILQKQTDEGHPMTTGELTTALRGHGISVSRQTLYEDIDVLNHYGFDIICLKGKENRYYIGNRIFERPEVEILVQAVNAANFLTVKKKSVLLQKIYGLSGASDLQELSTSSVVKSGLNGNNEHVYYNLDALMTALSEKRQVTFRYYDYIRQGEKCYRKNGERYIANPLGFAYSDGKLYFICYHDNHAEDGPTKYVLERIENVTVEEKQITDIEQYRNFDLTRYKREMFSMYAGERKEVTLVFPQERLNVAVERFGLESMRTSENGEYYFTVTVQVSKPFFGWLASFGGQVRIYAPEELKEQYKTFIKTLEESTK